MALISCSIFMG